MTATLDGKVVIVTGAGRGLGRAMTLGLLDAGARVAAVEIDTPSLGELRDLAEDRKADDRLLDIAGDVTHDTAAPKIVRATTDRFGRVDVLVNNVGGSAPGGAAELPSTFMYSYTFTRDQMAVGSASARSTASVAYLGLAGSS